MSVVMERHNYLRHRFLCIGKDGRLLVALDDGFMRPSDHVDVVSNSKIGNVTAS